VAARKQLAALAAQNAQLRSQQEQFRASMQNLQQRARSETGRPDKKRLLLFSTVSRFCDGEGGTNDAAGTLKPLLLTHRVNGADIGFTPSAEDNASAPQEHSDTESENEKVTPKEEAESALSATAALHEVIDLMEVSSPLLSPLTTKSTAFDDEPKTEANEQAAQDNGSNGQGVRSTLPRKSAKSSRPRSDSTQQAARTPSPAVSRFGPANESRQEPFPRSSKSQRSVKRHAAAA
jgi:hypothetical protein